MKPVSGKVERGHSWTVIRGSLSTEADQSILLGHEKESYNTISKRRLDSGHS